MHGLMREGRQRLLSTLPMFTITRNQIERLDKAAPRWFAVLLLRSDAAGYVLTCAQVAKRITNGSFELSGDGDFKVNEGLDLQPTEAFLSLDELLSRIM